MYVWYVCIITIRFYIHSYRYLFLLLLLLLDDCIFFLWCAVVVLLLCNQYLFVCLLLLLLCFFGFLVKLLLKFLFSGISELNNKILVHNNTTIIVAVIKCNTNSILNTRVTDCFCVLISVVVKVRKNLLD